MGTKDSYIELVKQAQLGDENSINHLAESVRKRLSVYIYRLTLDEDLTQDILQDSMLGMLEFLNKLEKPDRFWPWLFRIASNNLRDHWDQERLRRTASEFKKNDGHCADNEQALENMIGQELKRVISAAMLALKPRHREVLILRCYEEMTYSEISEVMACSEFAARGLFCRAKNALAKQLSSHGPGQDSLLMALVFFGKMTAPSTAAAAEVSVTAGALKVGFFATMATLATTKTAIVSLIAVGVLTGGAIVLRSNKWSWPKAPDSSQVVTQVISQQGSQPEAECWFYYPQGPSGSLMLKMKSGQAGQAGYWLVLQDTQKNCYYSNNAVQINNYRFYASNLSVMQLPTDDPAIADFLGKVEVNPQPVDHVPYKGSGLLVVANRGKLEEGAQSWATRHYNVPEEDYFISDWPPTSKKVDNRDEMHTRGWTYFRISGQINDATVVGTRRIPFVLASAERYSPWLKLQVGSLTIVDTNNEAYIQGSTGDKLSLYAGGSFFHGLSRPWMGLHTIDTVRRDAAVQRIAFKTEALAGGRYANVEVLCPEVKLIYKIDLETDVVDEITFFTNDGNTGNLKFLYLQSISGVDQEFIPPHRPLKEVIRKSSPGFVWLVKLIRNRLK